MPYAVITGATQGMGKAIAEKLLENGFSVAICARSQDNLDALAAEWKGRFPQSTVVTVKADLTKKEEVQAFAGKALAAFPTIDVLVNNAGTYTPGTIADEPEGALEKMLALNLYCAYHLTRKIVPVMKAKQTGHIFNICSIASLAGNATSGAYGISKYALMGFSDNLREELKQFLVKVTAIFPGSTLTASWDGSGVDPARILAATDIANTLWGAYALSPQANVEHIVMRPVKGDL